MDKVRETLEAYYALGMPRHHWLFEKFLPEGYQATTLSSVRINRLAEVIELKMLVGIFITLTDDFSEHPDYCSEDWVHQLALVTTSPHLSEELLMDSRENRQNAALGLSAQIYQDIFSALRKHSSTQGNLIQAIAFDFQEYYQCLRYSLLVSKQPYIACGVEYRHYSPQNMGMMIVGMIDLLFSPSWKLEELPLMRRIFYLAQRLGHIFNTLATFERERRQGDINNEIILKMMQNVDADSDGVEAAHHLLNEECTALYSSLQEYQLKTFSVPDYLEGIRTLQRLHETLEPYL